MNLRTSTPIGHAIPVCLLFIACHFNAKSQTVSAAPCSRPEFSQFNFWVGNWELTWNDTSRGNNNITVEMGNCLIHEHFSDTVNQYFGQSWSMYDTTSKKWKQTWVDNSGEYLDFQGGFENGTMILQRSDINKKGQPVLQRMIFFNIAKNTFDWDWESSTDGGVSWKSQWKIHYRRIL